MENGEKYREKKRNGSLSSICTNFVVYSGTWTWSPNIPKRFSSRSWTAISVTITVMIALRLAVSGSFSQRKVVAASGVLVGDRNGLWQL